MLRALDPDGPPVVVVCRDPGDESALDWFRKGVADCVTPGPQSGEVPLEQFLCTAKAIGVELVLHEEQVMRVQNIE